MGLIFVLSTQPHVPGPPQPLLDLILKKGGHFLGYGVLATLYARALRAGWAVRGVGKQVDQGSPAYSGNTPSAGVWFLAWLMAVLYAVSDEFHQSFVPGRDARFADVMIDASGAGVFLLGLARSRSVRDHLGF